MRSFRGAGWQYAQTVDIDRGLYSGQPPNIRSWRAAGPWGDPFPRASSINRNSPLHRSAGALTTMIVKLHSALILSNVPPTEAALLLAAVTPNPVRAPNALNRPPTGARAQPLQGPAYDQPESGNVGFPPESLSELQDDGPL